MRKTGLLLLVMMLCVGLLVGCGNNANNKDPDAGRDVGNDVAPIGSLEGYADGLYYAEGDYAANSGWKDIVALTIENGTITDVNWNALHRDGGLDKKTSSMKGIYGMVAYSDAQAEWHEQAELMEAFVIEQQATTGINVSADGKTDAVSGVSVTVDEFARLIAEALEAGPVQAGAYKDGYYYAEAADFDENSGWKETVDLTVMNGNIVAVQWNGMHKDGGTDKVERSKSGEYGMVAYSDAQSEWHEQALQAEQFLIEKQDPKAIIFADDGKTDAVSGVSITVSGFVQLVEQALAEAK